MASTAISIIEGVADRRYARELGLVLRTVLLVTSKAQVKRIFLQTIFQKGRIRAKEDNWDVKHVKKQGFWKNWQY